MEDMNTSNQMNCDRWIEQIWTYQELSLHEKEAVNQHLSTCLLCTQQMTLANAQKEMLLKVQDHVPHLVNAAQLTHSIMEALPKSPQGTLVEVIKQIINYPWLRYGLQTVSMVLAALLLSELDFSTHGYTKRLTQKDTGFVLNSQQFLQSYVENRKLKPRASLYAQYKQLNKKTNK
jgi:hypothetical protein